MLVLFGQLRVLLFVSLVAALVHVTWSGVLAYAVGQLYPHRLINVRAFNNDPAAFAPLAASLMKGAADKRLIVFVGSSWTFGYDYRESIVFTRHVARALPDAAVVNVSLLAGSTFNMPERVACALASAERE